MKLFVWSSETLRQYGAGRIIVMAKTEGEARLIAIRNAKRWEIDPEGIERDVSKPPMERGFYDPANCIFHYGTRNPS